MPGGYVYVTNSLMSRVNDDQLAAILAHEIAHITHKHGLKKFEEFQKQAWLKSLLGQKIFFYSTDLRKEMDYELQSDITGARYLKRAGYDPAIALSALNLLKDIDEENRRELERDMELEPERRKLIKKLIENHPPIDERIQKVSGQLDTINREEKVLFDEKDFVF